MWTHSQAECCHSPSKVGTGLGVCEGTRTVLGVDTTTCPQVKKPKFTLFLPEEGGVGVENALGLREV